MSSDPEVFWKGRPQGSNEKPIYIASVSGQTVSVDMGRTPDTFNDDPGEAAPPPASFLDILSNFALSVGKDSSSTTGTNSQQISPSKDKTAELNDVLVAVGDKFNLTCRYKGFDKSSTMEIQWQKDSFPLISASPGFNNKFDVDNMFIQFNGDCDSKLQPCIADLHVQNAEPSDSGLYQCVGSSDIGATRSAFYNVKVINHYRPNDVKMNVFFPDGSKTLPFSSIGQGQITIYQGQPVTFQCSSNGFPSPSLNFYLEDSLIEVFARTLNSIEVVDVSIAQTGSSREQNMTVNNIGLWKSVLKWQCTARNVEGESKSPQIFTRYHFAPQIISTRTEWRVLKHTDVSVPCYYREGFPTDTEVRWVFGSKSQGHIVSRNQNLTFKAEEFDSGKAGDYTCIVENAVGADSLTINLLVDYAPIVSLDQSSVRVGEGERLTLVCRVSAQPEATIQWTLKGDSANMEFRQFKDRPSLVIQSVEQFHSGKISCIATNKYGSTEAHATVTVQYAPSINLKIEPSRSTNDYREGERVKLKCIVDSVPPPKSIIIARDDGAPFQHSGETSGESKKEVEISPLQRSHSGQYKCLANNGLGVTNEHTISLRVQFGPEITKMSAVYKNEGSSLTLNCLVQSEPPATVVWSHPTKGQVSNKRQLEVTRVSRSDSGSYTCTASVKYFDGVRQTDIQKVDVFVNYEPEIKICGDSVIEDGVFAKLGSPVKLCCAVNSFPQSTIGWLKLEQGSSIPQSLPITPKIINQTSNAFSSQMQSIITLPQLSQSNLGTYLCEAKNSLSSKTRHIYVRELHVPEAPLLNTASPDNMGGIRLMWQTDKLAKYYQIGYRVDGSSDGYKVLPSKEDRDTSVIPDLQAGKPYQFVVRSCNDAGCSQFSNPLSSKPIPFSGPSIKGASQSIPISTVVVVPLALVGIILLLSLLIVICRRRHSNRRAQKDVRAVATDAYTLTPKYVGVNQLTSNSNGNLPHCSSAGSHLMGNFGATLGAASSAPLTYNIKGGGLVNGGGELPSRNHPPLATTVTIATNTNGHVVKGFGGTEEKFNPHNNYITITQPNGSLVRSKTPSSNEGGKFSPTPSQTSPSSVPEEHVDLSSRNIYLHNMSMDRVAFSKLKGGDGSLSDSSTKERDRVRFTDANGRTHYPGGEDAPDMPSKFNTNPKMNSVISTLPNSLGSKYCSLPTAEPQPSLLNYRSGSVSAPAPAASVTSPTTVVLPNGNLPQSHSVTAPAQIAISPDIYIQQQPGLTPKPLGTPHQAPAPPLRKTQRLSPTETNGVPLGTVVKSGPALGSYTNPANLIPPNTKFVVYPPQSQSQSQSDKQSSSLTSSNSPQMGECVSPFTDSMTGSLSSDNTNTNSNRSQTGFSVTSV